MCTPSLSKKSYIIVKNGLSGDSPQCGEMSRSDKGEGHVLSAPAPTIWLFFVNAFVGDGVLDVPKLVFRQPEGAQCAPLQFILNSYHFFFSWYLQSSGKHDIMSISMCERIGSYDFTG